MSNLVDNVPMADGEPEARKDGPAPDSNMDNSFPTEDELNKHFPDRPRNDKETFTFYELQTTLLEPLLANSKRKPVIGLRGKKDINPHESRRNIIDKFISRWRTEVGNDIFPAFRLVLCEKDRDRNVYHLKEQKIGKLLVEMMKINKDGEDGYALLHWRQPGTWSNNAGDFALRCFDVIKKRPMRTTPGSMTITQVNDLLDRLSLTTAEDLQLAIMTEFYNSMSAEELVWLIRIMLKQMKIGATEKTFFDAWHPDAYDLYNVTSSLRRVCWDLWNPDFLMEDDTKSVALMSCFQPQLAQFQKKTLESAIKGMNGQEFWIEEKLDGERLQMHMCDGEFRWWSRKAKEYTYLYGSTFDNGSMSQFLKIAFDKRVKSIILDGEMITWDPKMDCIVGFGTLKTAAIETSNNPFTGNTHRPLFRVFDILHLNGQCLLDYTLEDRRKALKSVATDVFRRFEIHPYTVAKTVTEIESELRQVISTASEGLVVKNPRSIYRLNDRNDDWVKVKPEYMTEFGESLDLLVIGGYWGSGKRGNMLASYLCGLRCDGNDSPPGANPMKFFSFCKVGGGFTALEYSTIAHQTEGRWINWDDRPPSKDLIVIGSRKLEKPDVWIHPEDSFVIEAKAASVTSTDQFRTGFSVRFPRFKKLRPDKNWHTALGIREFMQMKEDAIKQANSKKLNIEIRRGSRKRIKKGVQVVGADDSSSAQLVTPLDSNAPRLFTNHAFYIMSTTKPSKPELEAFIKHCGGKICQSEDAFPDTHVIGDRNTVKVAALVKRGTHDIIRPSWVLDCIRQHEISGSADECFILPLEPKYLHYATARTLARSSLAVDEYGDSYYRSLDVPGLELLLQGMHAPASHRISIPRPVLIGREDFRDIPAWMFSGCIVTVVECEEYRRRELESLVGFAGGKVIRERGDENKEGITHLVVGRPSIEREVIAAVLPSWVVSAEWVDESFIARKRLDEQRFLVG